MEAKIFFIEYSYNGKNELAEIKPCCGEDDAHYYDVFIRNHYEFTVTPSFNEDEGLIWRVSFKNADKTVNNDLIDIIGLEIEKHLF